MRTSSFDSEFNSASNGATFIHGTSSRKKPNPVLFLVHGGHEDTSKKISKLVPWIKVAPFDAELNSESNEVALMDGTYF